MVILSRNPIHSVLFLILTFFCLSGHYILLNAQFLAAVNIIVYAGAIMVLFLFMIMFLNMRKNEERSLDWPTLLASVIIGSTVFVVLAGTYRKTDVGTYNPYTFDSQTGMIEKLGQVLFREYLLPFELVSVLFLIAMTGAVLVGKREVGERHF